VITVQGNNYGPQGAENREQGNQLKTQNSKLLTVQPNPTTDRIWLDLTDFAGETVTVLICNGLGQLVWHRQVPKVEEVYLPVSLRETGAATGVFIVRVRGIKGTVSKQVVLIE
jgi:hypothetical protein